jgi:hypothetical protein
MKIDWAQTVAGIPLKEIRRFLLPLTAGVYPSRRAQPHLEALLAAGYLSRIADDPNHIELTELGRRLCATRPLPRMSRTKAETLFAGVLDRARALNADATLPYTVRSIAVFGSFNKKPDDPNYDNLGDIDLIVDTALRPGAKLAWSRAWAIAYGPDSAQRGPFGPDRWTHHHLRQRVRGKDARVCFVSWGDDNPPDGLIMVFRQSPSDVPAFQPDERTRDYLPDAH